MVRLIDTHCHLTSDAFAQDFDQVLAAAKLAGVERIVVPAVDLESSRQVVELARRNPQLFAAVGVQPEFSGSFSPDQMAEIEELARSESVVAIGEIGLDFHYVPSDVQCQERVFEQMLKLASKVGKPVLIHSRDAMEPVLTLLKKWIEGLEQPALKDLALAPGIIHAFEGNVEQADRAVALNFALGVGGPITYRGAALKRAVFEQIGLEHLVLETDAPYLPPHPYRGKRNEPAFIRYIAEKLSEVTHRPLEIVVQETTNCAWRVFRWEE